MSTDIPRQRATTTGLTLDRVLSEWRKNLSRAEEANRQYHEGLVAHRQKNPHLSPTSSGVDYDKSFAAKQSSAAEDWAMRRATMYGIAVLVMRGDQQGD